MHALTIGGKWHPPHGCSRLLHTVVCNDFIHPGDWTEIDSHAQMRCHVLTQRTVSALCVHNKGELSHASRHAFMIVVMQLSYSSNI